MVSLLHRATINSNISPTRPHNMLNFGPLAAEIGSLVWKTEDDDKIGLQGPPKP